MKMFASFAFVILGCAAQSTSTPAAPTAPQVAPAPAPAPASPPQWKNLQVLPTTLTRDELVNIMKSFTRGLGVRCNHCHVVTATEPREQFDFPNDTKATKRAAREMIKTVNALNKELIPRVVVALGEEAHDEMYVTCWTCHRGKQEPESPPPPPPQPPAAPATPPPPPAPPSS